MTRQTTNVLLVDEGNTFVKWAIFNSNMEMISGTEKSITARFLNKLKKENPKSLLNGKALRKSQHRLLKQTKE
jgi:pantothenate kinase type III